MRYKLGDKVKTEFKGNKYTGIITGIENNINFIRYRIILEPINGGFKVQVSLKENEIEPIEKLNVCIDEASELSDSQIEKLEKMITKEESLKVSKDIYDYIKKNISHNGLVSIVSEFHQHNNYNVTPDEMIEFCQALKAYPNIEPKQEQLYYVKIVDNGKYSFYLRKHKDFKHLSTGLSDDSVSYQYKYQFTRKEVEEISKKESKDHTPFMIKVEIK